MTTTPTSGAADLPEALNVDRSEAVNLARNFTVEDGIVVTQKGVRILADAVLLMDAALTAQAISAEPAGSVYAELPDGELLPCPCCGGEAREYERFNANRVACKSCGLNLRQSEQGAGDAGMRWNRRASHGQSPAGATDPQLLKFYGVTTDAELIAAQARHIERLQAKLPQAPSFAPQRAREG